MRRANNQDSFISLPAESEERFRSRGHLFVVADGMGAHVAGELASKMATERIAMNYFRGGSRTAAEALYDSVVEANAEIHDKGQKNPEFHNMGTTCSAMALTPEGVVVAHVGDSRVYRLRGNTFEQLTFDHSLVWEMEATGQIHPDSVLGKSIPKNVITRSLGPGAEVQVDIEGPLEIQAGDVFMACSDGLTGLVEDPEIGAIISSLDESRAARVLVDLANLRGGPDNSTVVIARATEDWEQAVGTGVASSNARNRPLNFSPLLIGATVACGLAAVGLGLLAIWGPMVVALVLLIISAVATFVQAAKPPASPANGLEMRNPMGGKGPYRRYDASPSADLSNSLGATVDALKNAAVEKHWAIDWSEIDSHRAAASKALVADDPEAAVRHQAEAILETMNQLRAQNDRAANDTDVDL